jgi:integrase
MSLDAALGELNARLKADHHKCSVEQRKASLVLRATLVDRSDPTTRRRQRISLELPATYGALPEAERKAIELAHQLRTGTFSWDLWDEPQAATTITVADFRAAAERLHASKYRNSPERGSSAWSKKWAPALRKLPPSGVITEAVLLRCIRKLPEGTASRRDQGNLLAQIAKSIGLDPEPLQAACRGYGVDRLTERDIPTDRVITTAFHSIRLPHWKWTWGMCAAYGLRPHECAGLTWLPEGDWIEIADATKTGSRRVTPCPSSWVTDWDLRDLPRPVQPATTITKAFNDALDRDGITTKPYNLRHAYALRLLDRGVSADLGARLMGHSLQVHQSTYQRWIEADRIQKAMQGMTL